MKHCWRWSLRPFFTVSLSDWNSGGPYSKWLLFIRCWILFWNETTFHSKVILIFMKQFKSKVTQTVLLEPYLFIFDIFDLCINQLRKYYVAYLGYPPLFFAGPILSFNAFVSQLEQPILSYTAGPSQSEQLVFVGFAVGVFFFVVVFPFWGWGWRRVPRCCVCLCFNFWGVEGVGRN